MSCCEKHLFCWIITLFLRFLITENKHLSPDPQLSSVTRNGQIYSTQLPTLKTGFFKFKEFLNFIIVRRNLLLHNFNFCFKDTRFVYFITDPELSSSLNGRFSDISYIIHTKQAVGNLCFKATK